MIHLLLVDDQRIIRQGLRSLLEANADLQVVGDAENGEVALECLAALEVTPPQADVVLMDVRMPVMDGVAATRHIHQRFPQIRILMLTTFDDDEYVSQAMRCGATGYLLKHASPEELATAVRVVNQGYTHMAPGLFQKALTPPPTPEPMPPPMPPELAQLSPREREVLRLIAIGFSNREIAHSLYISERTVRNHVTSILGQLGLRDRTQAALLSNGFLPLL